MLEVLTEEGAEDCLAARLGCRDLSQDADCLPPDLLPPPLLLQELQQAGQELGRQSVQLATTETAQESEQSLLHSLLQLRPDLQLPHQTVQSAQSADLGAEGQAGAAGGQHAVQGGPAGGAGLETSGQLAPSDDGETGEEQLANLLYQGSDGESVVGVHQHLHHLITDIFNAVVVLEEFNLKAAVSEYITRQSEVLSDPTIKMNKRLDFVSQSSRHG